MQTVAEGKHVVEAGALLGYSTIALARKAGHVTSIDRHEGYPWWNPSPTLPLFEQNLKDYAAWNVTTIVGSAEEELPKHRGELAVIDLDGRFETTQKALGAAQCPLLLVHDACRSSCEGVEQALKDYEIIEGVGTFVLCRRRR